jgi:penicillin V acylase-like amidase (Ntn superfamily)
MNKNGVSISINVSGNAENTHQKDAITLNYDKINLNSFALVRLILDYAKDVKDALELMSNFYLNDMSFEYNEPIHYQITDKTGTSVIVEFKEGFTMPTIVVTPEFVAKADKEHKYDIAGKNKKFIINENFNLSNLDANFGEAKFDS